MRSLVHELAAIYLRLVITFLIAVAALCHSLWAYRTLSATLPPSQPVVFSYERVYCVMDASAEKVQGYVVAASTTTAGRCQVLAGGPYYGFFPIGTMLDDAVTAGVPAQVLLTQGAPRPTARPAPAQ
jgi:hypothetical protein